MRRISLAILMMALGVSAACAAPATVTPTPVIGGGGSAYPVASPTASGYPAATAGSGQSKTFVIVPEQTSASYTIDEIFFNQNNKLATAVGVTSAINGELLLNSADPASSTGQFTADLSTLKSDQNRRDNAIRRDWLESSTFPLATFTIKEVRDFPANPQAGQPITFKLVGDMLIKETTHESVWDVTATLNGDTLTGTATTFIMLADFNVPVPNIAGMLKVTDGATLKLDFTFKAK